MVLTESSQAIMRWSFPARAGLKATRINRKPRQNRIRNLPNLITSSFPFLLVDSGPPCLGNLTKLVGWRQGKNRREARGSRNEAKGKSKGAGSRVSEVGCRQ
jgi:hypothetical protein